MESCSSRAPIIEITGAQYSVKETRSIPPVSLPRLLSKEGFNSMSFLLCEPISAREEQASWNLYID